MVKRPSVMREMQVQSLDWEDPLEKEMATHSITLAWKIPWAEEPGRLQFLGSQTAGQDLGTKPPPPQEINTEREGSDGGRMAEPSLALT